MPRTLFHSFLSSSRDLSRDSFKRSSISRRNKGNSRSTIPTRNQSRRYMTFYDCLQVLGGDTHVRGGEEINNRRPAIAAFRARRQIVPTLYAHALRFFFRQSRRFDRAPRPLFFPRDRRDFPLSPSRPEFSRTPSARFGLASPPAFLPPPLRPSSLTLAAHGDRACGACRQMARRPRAAPSVGAARRLGQLSTCHLGSSFQRSLAKDPVVYRTRESFGSRIRVALFLKKK